MGALLVALLLGACAERRAAVAFSERPELRAEPVTGCGGGALRFLVPELALPALHEAALAELDGEPAWDLESERIPCETCGAHNEVCGYVVIRYRDLHEGRAGLRLRFSSSVVNSTRSWRVLDSERVLDEARLFGAVSYEDARDVLAFLRSGSHGSGPIDSILGIDAHSDVTAPRGAQIRVARIVRVEEGGVIFRYLYLRRAAETFVIVDERTERIEGWFPPPVRGKEERPRSSLDETEW